MLSTLLDDLRFGVRQLRKNPAFTLTAALTLTLGIGANATIFSWLNSVILNPLPCVDSRDLVSVRWRTPEGHGSSFSWRDYLDMKGRAPSLASLTVGTMAPFSLGESTQPERIWGSFVSSNYFTTLGVKPVRGRAFVPEEDGNPGGYPVTLISYRLWRDRFGGDSGIVGRKIRLDNRDFSVVGVTPAGFQGSILGLTFDLYVPASMAEAVSGETGMLSNRNMHWLLGHARLKPGTDRRQAEAELTALSSQLARESLRPDLYARAEIIPIWREGGGQMLAPVIMLLMAVAGVVLLIACANVANLVLARASGRSREIAIRQALGVSRRRLMAQLLVENGMLALLGAAGALLIIPAAGSLLMQFAPVTDFPVLVQVSPDRAVLLFTLGVTVLATILFGLIPALRASRPDVVTALKQESGASAGPRRAWLRNSLVVAQVTLSLVLLVGAGLLLKSLSRAVAADPGFDPRNVLVSGVDLVSSGYNEARGRIALREMLARISALPGVAAVSTVDSVPLGLGGSSSTSVEVEGYVPSKNEEMLVPVHTIGPDYFHAMNTRLVAGREFTLADSDSTERVVMINATFARRYFPKLDPVGRHVKLRGQTRTVAGVARDSKTQSLDEKPRPAVYLPVLQEFASESNFLVRTLGKPMAMARAVEDAIHAVNPALPVYGQRSLEQSISVAYFGQSMGGSLLGVFGGLALALAAVGLYGVLAYAVTQRSREVGIRMALGAARGDVLRLILGQGLRIAGIGLAIGLTVSIALTRLMSSLLFGVSPRDPATMLAVSLLLLAVALAASLLPAYRATKIDPILAIRHE
ncbi:MAG TPA: ABC transporter permease [Bryobacteraceae bacterium]|nr:ABC transporter permease [Bryobacteraceae bacterium]